MTQLDIFSDPICPWCYIGKRRFEAARSESGRAVDLLGGEGLDIFENGLVAVRPRRSREARVKDLRRFRIADSELFRAIDVAAGGVRRRTDEAKIVLPAHRHSHVLWSEIEGAVRVPGADQHQGCDREEAIPDGS